MPLPFGDHLQTASNNAAGCRAVRGCERLREPLIPLNTGHDKMDARKLPQYVLAVAVFGAIGGSLIMAAPPPRDNVAKDNAVAPGATIPLRIGNSIPLSVRSNGVEWRGNTYHVVNLSSIQFELDKQTSRLKAEIKAAVMQFNNMDYDVSAAVFDAEGRLLGVARARCEVGRFWSVNVVTGNDTLSLDFGVSLDYVRAASFMVCVSNRKALTPDEWQK
jgi:hypothetical protein